jgi:endonuclease YncB( thermonuclease family)
MKKIVYFITTIILFSGGIVLWSIVDNVGEAVGETIAGAVGTDIDKSSYYLTDEELLGLFSKSTLARNKCQVTRVADGDTIDVLCPFGKEETIRYAHIDTPEVWKKVNGKWQEDNQCYGKEASNINKELVEGKKVWVLDQSFTKDVYNRRISNVIVNEGKDKNLNVNAFLLGEGFATAYYSSNPLDKFLNTGKEENIEYFESKAKKNNKGLWGKCN